MTREEFRLKEGEMYMRRVSHICRLRFSIIALSGCTNAQKPRKNAALRMRPTVFSLSLRFVFNCQEQQVHREDAAGCRRGAFSDSPLKSFRVRSRRFHVVMSVILILEERKREGERNVYRLFQEKRPAGYTPGA